MIQRRQIFKRILGQNARLRVLPYYEFEDCSECLAPCVSACKSGLLSFDGEVLKFTPTKKGCLFCKECANACLLAGKKTLNPNLNPAFKAKAFINPTKCLAWNNTMCYVCMDACKDRAIEFFGLFRPMVKKECTGCGACFSPCPVAAFEYKEMG